MKKTRTVRIVLDVKTDAPLWVLRAKCNYEEWMVPLVNDEEKPVYTTEVLRVRAEKQGA